MVWYVIVILSLGLVAAAELGDKTQLMTISLASKFGGKPVFFGTLLGMGVITVIGVLIGTTLYSFFPLLYVKVAAGLIFIIFGIYSFYKEERGLEKDVKKDEVFHKSFFLSLIAELGDKTQLAVIALSARYGNPFFVLIGALAGLALIIAAGVLLGTTISKFVEREKIDFGAAVMFVVIGILFVIEALFF